MTELEPIPPLWADALPQLATHYMEIAARLAGVEDIRPTRGLWFEALRAVTPDAARVVILGQDPYHGEDHGIQQAHGLAFSVPEGVRPPPSLRNILKEAESDLNRPAMVTMGNLRSWAEQGVLLLNASLTTIGGQAGAHTKQWHPFTQVLMDYLGNRPDPLVFILWGGHAQKHRDNIGGQHAILQSAHPSPLSAYQGFFGSKPFSTANRILESWGKPAIAW